jgi:hypothetical protein
MSVLPDEQDISSQWPVWFCDKWNCVRPSFGFMSNPRNVQRHERQLRTKYANPRCHMQWHVRLPIEWPLPEQLQFSKSVRGQRDMHHRRRVCSGPLDVCYQHASRCKHWRCINEHHVCQFGNRRRTSQCQRIQSVGQFWKPCVLSFASHGLFLSNWRQTSHRYRQSRSSRYNTESKSNLARPQRKPHRGIVCVDWLPTRRKRGEFVHWVDGWHFRSTRRDWEFGLDEFVVDEYIRSSVVRPPVQLVLL